MTEYISREAVLALAKDICVLTKWDSEYRHRSIDPLDVIELPAADVRPVVRGRWKLVGSVVHGGQGRNITHWKPLPQPPKEE